MRRQLKQTLKHLKHQLKQPEWKATAKIRAFGLMRVPLLLMVSPKVVRIDEAVCQLQIPLNKITRNHVGSMYFGTLCIGAEATAGILAVNLMDTHNKKLGFIFKDFSANFIRRAEEDVLFECLDGAAALEAIEAAVESGERHQANMNIRATGATSHQEIAEFTITLSLKKSAR